MQKGTQTIVVLTSVIFIPPSGDVSAFAATGSLGSTVARKRRRSPHYAAVRANTTHQPMLGAAWTSSALQIDN